MNLSEDEAEGCLDSLLHDPNEALISAVLVLLRAKGETYEEVSVCVCKVLLFVYFLLVFVDS